MDISFTSTYFYQTLVQSFRIPLSLNDTVKIQTLSKPSPKITLEPETAGFEPMTHVFYNPWSGSVKQRIVREAI